MTRSSNPLAELARQVATATLPKPRAEYTFDRARGYRFGLVWLPWKFAIDLEGRARELDKHQAAWVKGWQVLRVSAQQVRSGEALEFVRMALDTE